MGATLHHYGGHQLASFSQLRGLPIEVIRRNNTFDAGRAAQNLMLTATANGLGTVPQGFDNPGQVRAFLNLPMDRRVLIGFAIGYPADDPDETIEGIERNEELEQIGRRPISDLLHWECYN